MLVMDAIGILLAAGHSRRFGTQNKLMQSLPDGSLMVDRSARHLVKALPISVAVVRPKDLELHDALRSLDLDLAVCDADDFQMSKSLATGVRLASAHYPGASGFVIALADMPFIRPETIAEVGRRIRSGSGIVVPVIGQRRGHPVGFSARYAPELLALTGDVGAKALLERHASAVELLPSDDAGILKDIDTPDQLEI